MKHDSEYERLEFCRYVEWWVEQEVRRVKSAEKQGTRQEAGETNEDGGSKCFSA